MIDVLIIGGGPAGMTAAIYATRAGKEALLLEKAVPGGQILYSPLVENYPSYAHISGFELATQMREQVEALGVTIKIGEAKHLIYSGNGFTVFTDEDCYEAKTVILAAGVSHRRLGLPGEEELVGAGISYCAVCDGAFYEGRPVAVVGGGDAALQDALFLANTSSKVYLIHRRDSFRAEAKLAARAMTTENIEILYSHVPEAYEAEDGILTGLRLLNKKTGKSLSLPVDGIFLAVGQKPENGLVEGLTALSPEGYVAAGEDTATEIPGLFAAGDCRRKSLRQLTTAVADGANAAIAACEYIDAQ